MNSLSTALKTGFMIMMMIADDNSQKTDKNNFQTDNWMLSFDNRPKFKFILEDK